MCIEVYAASYCDNSQWTRNVPQGGRRLRSSLKAFLGESFYGTCFEALGHLKLTRNKQVYSAKPLVGKKRPREFDFDNLAIVFNLPVMILRSIRDIAALPVGTYGLPLFGNFPLVDAIIQPNMLIQFTTSPNKHKGAVDKLSQIRAQLLEKDESKHKMLFVVPKENLTTFEFQEDLSTIHQFVTCDDSVVSAEVLMSSSEYATRKRS